MSDDPFDRLFRFHFRVDAAGLIASVGPSLAKLLPDDAVGQPLTRLLDGSELPIDATAPPDDGWCDRLLRLRFNRSSGLGFAVRGEFVTDPAGGGGYLFAGSLDPEDAPRLQRLGLTASDFSANDLTMEFAMLKWARDSQVRETKSALARLERSMELSNRLRVRATTDELTGIANRGLFIEMLDQALDEDRPVTVMMIDVDRFKSVNDLHGHRVGDQLLVAVADELDRVVGTGGVVARIGGDEFAVLLTDEAAESASEQLIEQIVALNGTKVPADGAVVMMSLTLGVAQRRQEIDSGELLRHADVAMYATRRSQDGAVGRFDPAAQHQLDLRRLIADELLPAIGRREIELYFQPIVDLGSAVTIGFEVLSRWTHPVHGLIPPDLFVSVAEDSHMVHHLDRYVVASAIELARTHLCIAGEMPRLSINCSALSLTDQFADYLATTIADLDFSPSKLVIEVTETTSIADLDRTTDIMAALHGMGVTLSLDDFGTGYSSLTYLHKLPIGSLKIDRTFVNDMLESRKAMELVRSIVQVAKSLQLPVVAEGIESPEQAVLLRGLGCQYGQGYYFGRPVPPVEAALMAGQRLPIRLTVPT